MEGKVEVRRKGKLMFPRRRKKQGFRRGENEKVPWEREVAVLQRGKDEVPREGGWI